MEVLNSFLTWIFRNRLGQIENFKHNPITVQNQTFDELIEAGKRTDFGEKYGFNRIKSYADFARQVPVFDYESFKPYIEKTMQGKQRVIWNTDIEWFAKSSGTTSSRSKYIPVSEESLEECHYNCLLYTSPSPRD